MDHGDEDLQLLNRWRTGDQTAGQRLCARYEGIVHRFFRSKAYEASSDLTQATMEALVKSSDRYCADGSFRSYALGIARNIFRHHLRSCSRSRLDFNLDQLSCEDLGIGPLDHLLDDEDTRHLARCLQRIPVHHQIVIELHYWEGLSSIEIGEVLGVPPSTIRDRRRNAVIVLRKQLEGSPIGGSCLEATLVGLRTWAEAIKADVLGDVSWVASSAT